MSSLTSAPLRLGWRRTQPRRYLLVPRVVAGLPLLAIGLMHVTADGYGMRPLVEAAGFPFASLLAPLAVAAELVAGLSLLLGVWARIGALLAIVTMVAAAYAHFAIEHWPNAGGEPPLALPLIVMVCAAWVLWRGAGGWSVDGRADAVPHASE
jgi:putative oxidoreductase